jgi:hypothetical protein
MDRIRSMNGEKRNACRLLVVKLVGKEDVDIARG